MKILRQEVKQSLSDSKHDFFGTIDCLFFSAFNITDIELEFISENATKEDLSVFVKGIGAIDNPATFSDIKQALQIKNKYLKK
jgi:hypothetical protein